MPEIYVMVIYANNADYKDIAYLRSAMSLHTQINIYSIVIFSILYVVI